MAKDDPPLKALLRAADRVKRAETQLELARAALYAEITKARAAGVSLSALSRALGVTRQRVQKLVERIERDTSR
jgi:biotin operon repressor